ncbi:hypothetical protein ABZ901_16280 [Actinacidiphila alni]|uniref:hypothetical protein n=1 Tax=Actinacidiphila alni TaxID=380248 RepID=UPI0033D5D37A
MTAEQDGDEPGAGRLRAALARSVAARPASPAPVERIVAAGRARRRRRRLTMTATAACVVAAAVAVPLLRSAQPAPSVRQMPADGTSSASAKPTRTPATEPVTVTAGHGTVDGTAWSLTMAYYPDESALPADLPPPDGVPLVCQRPVIGGVLVDHQAGPWAGCEPVDGPDDSSFGGEMALRGLHDKGASGTRLFVSNTGPDVSYGVVRLDDGADLTGHAVTVPGTSFRAWVVAVPAARSIVSVDEYDSGRQRLSHSTDWQ